MGLGLSWDEDCVGCVYEKDAQSKSGCIVGSGSGGECCYRPLQAKEPQSASTNSAMPKLPCAKKWLEWCKVKAVPLDIQCDIYEWFKRQLSA